MLHSMVHMHVTGYIRLPLAATCHAELRLAASQRPETSISDILYTHAAEAATLSPEHGGYLQAQLELI